MAWHGIIRHHQMVLKEECDRNENVYKVVAMQEAEERRLRDQELERMRVQWLAQMKVPHLISTVNWSVDETM